MYYDNKSSGYRQKKGLNKEQLKQQKNEILLHSQDLIRTFSEIREESLIRNICIKVLRRANYDFQDLPIPLNDVLKIFDMKVTAEEFEDDKRTILEIDNYLKNDNDDEEVS